MLEEENPVYQRLNFIVEALENGNQAEFARRIGVRSGVVGDMFGKRKNKPSFDVLGKIAAAYPQLRVEWILLGEGAVFKVPEAIKTSSVHYDPANRTLVPHDDEGRAIIIDEPENSLHPAYVRKMQQELTKMGNTAPFDAHALGFLGDFPIVELPLVSFKARASFVELGGADVGAGNFERVLHRCGTDEHGNQRTPADYADAIVFEVDGDSMTPSMQSGQKVIAWPIPESKWEHLHNTACVVAYDDTVTVKAVLENDLFVNNRLTLRATKPGGGYFVVGRANIHSIWEVREFFGVVPYRLFS